MPSLTSWLTQSALVSSFAATATFLVYTKHCKFDGAVDSAADPVFRGEFYRRYNPNANPGLYDVCVRRVPLFKVRRELLEDAERGGGKLVERFCGGVYGCVGYSLQRKYLEQKYRSDRTKHQLWDKQEILESDFPEGTEVTDHFAVLDKSRTSILMRAGDSPLVSPTSPRASDGLFEITAVADLDKGFAEFRLKSIFFSGQGKRDRKSEGEIMEWAHRQYTKLLMETAVKNCMK